MGSTRRIVSTLIKLGYLLFSSDRFVFFFGVKLATYGRLYKARLRLCKNQVEFYELKTRVCFGRRAVGWKSLSVSVETDQGCFFALDWRCCASNCCVVRLDPSK